MPNKKALYTTNYQQVAEYATLKLRQILIRNPSHSVGLKKMFDFFFLNFQDKGIFSWRLGQSIKIQGFSAQSGPYGMSALNCVREIKP